MLHKTPVQVFCYSRVVAAIELTFENINIVHMGRIRKVLLRVKLRRTLLRSIYDSECCALRSSARSEGVEMVGIEPTSERAWRITLQEYSDLLLRA